LNKGFKRLFEARPPSAADVAKAYKIFDIRPGSDLSNLNAQWKTLARKHHPDLGGSLEKMKDVNWAKDILDVIASSGTRSYGTGSSYSTQPQPPRPKPPKRPPPPPSSPPPSGPEKMKTYIFTYDEVSIAGTFRRTETVRAKNEASAFKKLWNIKGNRDFDNVEFTVQDDPVKTKSKATKYKGWTIEPVGKGVFAEFRITDSKGNLSSMSFSDIAKAAAYIDDLEAKSNPSSQGNTKVKFNSVLRDIKGIVPGEKDIQRMKDIITKSNGNQAKMMSLVRVMAGAITDKDKAQRRAAAAFQILPPDIAEDAVMLFLSKF
jgi:hypothetical protein